MGLVSITICKKVKALQICGNRKNASKQKPHAHAQGSKTIYQ
jgi:hypothetical protein